MQKLFTNLTVSGYWLIAVNVLPLLGVLFFGWSTFSIVFIYWCENVLIGVINLLKMLTCSRHHAAKLFFLPFFTFHYGMFCFVHGVFVFALLGDGREAFDVWNSSIAALREQHLIWAVLGLGASHLLSFFLNYLGKGEYQRTIVTGLMLQPYGRIVVLHLAILLGAFATSALGSSVWLLMILIVGKTMLDLMLHLSERKKNASHPTLTSGGVA